MGIVVTALPVRRSTPAHKPVPDKPIAAAAHLTKPDAATRSFRRPELTQSPRYQDRGAFVALERLRATPGEISGAAMSRAILDAVRDKDGRAATAEFNDVRNFAHANWERLSPAARQRYREFEQLAIQSQQEGRTGIPSERLDGLAEQWAARGGLLGDFRPYSDASARAALSPLEEGGPVSAGGLLDAFRATFDRDGQLFGSEFSDFARFADHHWDAMTPGARAAFRVYEAAAQQARARGQTGGSSTDALGLLDQMRQAAALADDRRLQRPLRG